MEVFKVTTKGGSVKNNIKIPNEII